MADIDSDSDITPSDPGSRVSLETNLEPLRHPLMPPKPAIYPPPVALTPTRMSTRRSTRAVSQANSRGATPAIGVNDIPNTPAPRRARRAGNAGLPAVSLRPSTAYGTNTLPAPSTRMPNTMVSDSVSDVLNQILNHPPCMSNDSFGVDVIY